MTLELIVRPEAETDLSAAYEWYEERVSGLESDFLLNVDAAFHAILRNPQQFPILHQNLRRALVRRFPYQIFFVPRNIGWSSSPSSMHDETRDTGGSEPYSRHPTPSNFH